jgi:hypothetical protein
VQVYASPRLELFATSSYNRGTATISGLNYDVARLPAPITGLDFDLMNESFAGFSDLRVRQVAHTAGFNYRLSDSLLLNGALEFHDYDDGQPYLFDTTGRRVLTYFGLSWLF